ncbi:hypothetical protein GCM10027275_10120 [Rhabdobacter roseus]
MVKAPYRGNCRADFILGNLQKIPLDSIDYTMDNTHRLDVVFDTSPMQEKGGLANGQPRLTHQ